MRPLAASTPRHVGDLLRACSIPGKCELVSVVICTGVRADNNWTSPTPAGQEEPSDFPTWASERIREAATLIRCSAILQVGLHGSNLDRLKMEALSWGSTYRSFATRRRQSHFRSLLAVGR
jgi:hypothetical protein